MIRSEMALRSELKMLRVRYDNGAAPPQVYRVIKDLKRDVSWLVHEWDERWKSPTSIPAGELIF